MSAHTYTCNGDCVAVPNFLISKSETVPDGRVCTVLMHIGSESRASTRAA